MKLHAVTDDAPAATCVVTMVQPAHDTLTRVLLALRRPEVTLTGVAFADGREGPATVAISTAAPLPAAVAARLARLVGVLDVGVTDRAAGDRVGPWTVEDWEVRQTPTLSEAVLRLRGPRGRHLVLAEGPSPAEALRNARAKAAAETFLEPLTA